MRSHANTVSRVVRTGKEEVQTALKARNGTPEGRSVAQIGLLTDVEFRDDGAVALNVVAHQIIEQATALTYQLEQTTTRGVILLMRLEVVRQFVDPGREDGNLHFWCSGVRVALTELLDDFCLLFCRDHVRTSLD